MYEIVGRMSIEEIFKQIHLFAQMAANDTSGHYLKMIEISAAKAIEFIQSENSLKLNNSEIVER